MNAPSRPGAPPAARETVFGSRAAWYAWKLLVAVSTVGVVTLIYFPVGELTANRSVSLALPVDHAIPFIPWTWWIYFPGYLAGLVFTTLALRSQRTLYRTSLAILVTAVICGVIFSLFPSTFPRPTEAPATFTGDAIRWFWAFDPPNNTFPSMHVACAFLAATAMAFERHPLRWVTYAMAVGVLITIHTTKQHYIVDGLGGLAVAFVSWRLVLRWWPAGAPAPGSDARDALLPADGGGELT